MSRIIKLNQHVANLIAAGEVIERANSVVKELVENSIDAGATVINIYLKESGIEEIIVSDNGCGMSPIEAKLSIEPHATSKIKTEDDLFRISTLGFRGEALPSIVSVSDFRLKTSQDGNVGYMFSMKGGRFVSEATIAHPKGTEIIVKNLFFNTPARLQTLQTPSQELSHILEYVQKTALANPDLIIRLSNNDKVVFQTFGSGNTLEVINNIYGIDVSKSMIMIHNSDGFFEIKGLVSDLSVSRASKKHISIFVNSRPIKNYNITNAILQAYKNLLPIGRYPICVLDIKVDYSLVDVNVHPAKLELRFTDEDQLLDLITKSILEELSYENLIVKLDESKEDSYYDDWDYNNDDVDEVKKETIVKGETVFVDDDFTLEEVIQEDIKIKKEISHQQQYRLVGDDDIIDSGSNQRLPKMDYLGQLFGTYLLAQGDDMFYLIDQHAAMERIMYEKISEEFQKDFNLGYDLLLPIKLDFSASEAILINEKYNEIARLGLTIEDFGGGTFMLREVPLWIIKGHEKEFAEEIITHIISNKKTEKHEFMDNLAKKLACNKSIKANQYVSDIEISHLLDDLAKCRMPFTCPHGRPVIVSYSKYEIEKWFKRVM